MVEDVGEGEGGVGVGAKGVSGRGENVVGEEVVHELVVDDFVEDFSDDGEQGDGAVVLWKVGEFVFWEGDIALVSLAMSG